ncbi:hypothetical protein WJX74_009082 [Apatococcus lobatus]|uniref:Plasma membrane ATPase n=1 Tax=Apatococcus lobatus TaxID=904363 RepID=A0AAW1RL27_9CHLO
MSPPAISGLTSEEVKQLRQRHGPNEVKAKQKPEWRKILRRYTDWVSLTILAAAIVSACVKNDGDRGWTSFVLLILELNLVVWAGYSPDRNAGNAIKELEELSAPTAYALRDGTWQDVPAKELVPGDIIEVKGGDVIPADCRLIGKGAGLKIDESSLTGESMAVSRGSGHQILSGAVVASGEMQAEVTSIGAETFFGKTIALLGAPEEKGHLFKVLNQISITLAILAFLLVIGIFVAAIVRGKGVGYAFIISFVVYVAVVPIGIPVVTGTVLAVGAREMAKEKAIVSRLSALEEMSGMEILASDKTGTLTLNKLTLDPEDIVAWEPYNIDEVLSHACLSAKWENNDAIDQAVTTAIGGNPESLSQFQIHSVVPFNPVDKKTSASVTGPDGSSFVTCKGAPQIIAALLKDHAAQKAAQEYIDQRASRGLRSICVADSHDEGQTWVLVGLISLLDPPREDSAATIKRAQELGVEVKMVTGDQLAIAVETCRRLGMGTDIMEGKELMSHASEDLSFAKKVNNQDGFAGVYPEHKHKIVSALQAKGRLIGMTGDGVNDAPALKKANVDIAVAGATGAAKGAADIILTEEGISTIITAIVNSRKIFRRLETYVIYRVACSLFIILFFFFAIVILDLEMPTWTVVVLSLFNDLSAMALGLDQVHSSNMPEIWNMLKITTVAIVIAVGGTGAVIILLIIASPTLVNGWPAFNTTLPRPPADQLAPELTDGAVVAIVFLGLMGLLQLSLLLTRNPSFWWYFSKKTAPRPSIFLVVPIAAFCLAGTFVAVYWPRDLQPDGGRGVIDGATWAPVGLTWAYIFVWWNFTDVMKWAVWKVFLKQEAIKEHCKMDDTQPPAWCRAMDAPGIWVSRTADCVSNALEEAWRSFVSSLRQTARRKPTRTELQANISRRLSKRELDGSLPPDAFDNNNSLPALSRAPARPTTAEAFQLESQPKGTRPSRLGQPKNLANAPACLLWQRVCQTWP